MDEKFNNPELRAAEAELRLEGDDAEPLFEWENETPWFLTRRPNNLDYSGSPERSWARRARVRNGLLFAIGLTFVVLYILSR